MRPRVQPTGREQLFPEDDIIVSKTDLKGRITYANDVFMHVSGYTEEELLGAPHNVIRHPEMPRSVFKLLWDTIMDGQEIFAYVVNLCKNGDHYWVHAHVTPSFDESGQIVGYHSNRRVPDRAAVEKAAGLYRLMLAEEERHGDDWRAGMEAATAMLVAHLEQSGQSYEELVFSL